VTDGPTQAMDAPSLARADDAGREPGVLSSGRFRKVALLAVFAVVFLTIGVPRFLAGDPTPVNQSTPGNFANLCHVHGGTVVPGNGAQTEPFCQVRYGAHVYRMDAITSSGFDADTAAFQRQGCQEANDEAKAAAGGGKPDRIFVYHVLTGVCEHQP
jgi:hypothetical protein